MRANTQNNGDNISIVLPTTSRLSGACLWDDGIAAVDGYSPYIYLFDDDGCFTAALPSRRAYDSISSIDGDEFVCCGCGCDKNVYFLNENFEETGAMTPETSSGSAKSASFYTEPPFDSCVAVTFDRCIKLFRRSGEYVSTLKEQTDDVSYLCYQSFPGGDCTAYEKGDTNRISVNDNNTGNSYTLSTDSCSTPKSIILKPCGDVWAVIGYRYVYNDLTPIFTDGRFNGNCRIMS